MAYNFIPISSSKEVIKLRMLTGYLVRTAWEKMKRAVPQSGLKSSLNTKSCQNIKVVDDIRRAFCSYATCETAGSGTQVMSATDFIQFCCSERSTKEKIILSLPLKDPKIPPIWKGSKTFLRDLAARETGIITLQDFYLIFHILTNKPDFFKPIFKVLSLEKNFLNADDLRRIKISLVGNKNLPTDLTFSALSIHLIGPSGTGVFRYKDFKRFAEDIQAEVLEIEYEYLYSTTRGYFGALEFVRWLTRFDEKRFEKSIIMWKKIPACRLLMEPSIIWA